MSEADHSGDARPLYEREVTTRFGDRVEDYSRARPGYPAEAIDAILRGLGEATEVVAADVGAGTGISARMLAQRGARVFAIEPNAPMREAGERSSTPQNSHPHPNARDGNATGRISWHDGRAEATGLGDASVYLVLCAQSYHWFEPVLACREFGRILRPGGRLALMWNDGDEATPVAKCYYDLVRAASVGGGPTSHQTVARGPRVAPPFDRAPARALRFCHEHRLDEAGLIARAMSASYVPKRGAAAELLVEGLRALHREHVGDDGRVGMVYQTLVWLFSPDPGSMREASTVRRGLHRG